MTAVDERGVLITGLGISEMGRRLGIPALDLTERASRMAIEDAGLQLVDIDGVATMGDTPPGEAAARLGIEPRWMNGGGPINGGLLAPVMDACFAVARGDARHVLVYRTVQMMGGNLGGGRAPSEAPPGPSPRQEVLPQGIRDGVGDMADAIAYHSYSAANLLAMHCQRHMAMYGTTKEQLGWLAINSRRNAGLNPQAAYRDPITMDDYLAARPISSPFGLLDCDVPIDGSVAFVVSTPGAEADAPQPTVRVQAFGGSNGPGGWCYRPDYPKMANDDAAAQMWSRTDLRPADVDFAQLYDGFTFLTLEWLEALGFCAEGESGPFVEGAERIALEGQLPLNTYGGQLSAGRMHGNWILHEACLQLRGWAGERQVPRHEVAVISNGGGPIAGCMLLTA
jgi:acetyl-CoA acetyltransferase